MGGRVVPAGRNIPEQQDKVKIASRRGKIMKRWLFVVSLLALLAGAGLLLYQLISEPRFFKLENVSPYEARLPLGFPPGTITGDTVAPPNRLSVADRRLSP